MLTFLVTGFSENFVGLFVSVSNIAKESILHANHIGTLYRYPITKKLNSVNGHPPDFYTDYMTNRRADNQSRSRILIWIGLSK